MNKTYPYLDYFSIYVNACAILKNEESTNCNILCSSFYLNVSSLLVLNNCCCVVSLSVSLFPYLSTTLLQPWTTNLGTGFRDPDPDKKTRIRIHSPGCRRAEIWNWGVKQLAELFKFGKKGSELEMYYIPSPDLLLYKTISISLYLFPHHPPLSFSLSLFLFLFLIIFF